MPSTYTLNNGIELIATGEQSGTWGDTTNTNLSLVDTALDGQVTVTLPSAGTSGSPNTLAISDGAASDGRNRMVIFNDGGDLGATAYVQLTPNDAEKIIYVRNDLAGSRSIILFQGTYNASNDYELPAGTTAVIYFDGAGSGAVAANVFNNAYFDSLRLGSVSVTEIIDDDTMATAAATNIATSESIKAYVDAQVGANNELSEVLANGNTTGGTDISVSTGDDITFADNSKAIFGAGSDLQIYHDGSNSRIADQGVGGLILQGDAGVYVKSSDNTETMAQFVKDGEVSLWYDNSSKLATTSTGVDITGTLTSDGLTVDGAIQVNATVPSLVLEETDTTDINGQVAVVSGITHIRTINDAGDSVTNRLSVNNSTGDITFYDTSGNASFVYDESAGSTFNENGDNKDFRVESSTSSHMLFVDASAGRVAIGTSDTTSSGNLIVAGSAIIGRTSTTTGDFFSSGGGNSASYNGIAIMSNSDAINAQSNTSLSSWIVDVGGRAGDGITFPVSTADSFSVRRVAAGGTYYGAANYLQIDAGEAVFNEDSNDQDFRVESNDSSTMFSLDGGNNNILICDDGSFSGNSGRILTIATDSDASSGTVTDPAFIQFRDTDNVSTGTGDNINPYAGIEFYSSDTSGSGPGVQASMKATYADVFNASTSLRFDVGTVASPYRVLDLYNNAVIVNQDGESVVDFRVESDSYTGMLFVDASANQVTMGGTGSNDAGILTLGTPGQATYVTNGTEGEFGIIRYNNTQSSTQHSGIVFRVTTNNASNNSYGSFGLIQPSYNRHDSRFYFNLRSQANNTRQYANIDSEVGWQVNDGGEAHIDFRVESDNNANMLFVDAGIDRVGIGTNGAISSLDVMGSQSSKALNLRSGDTNGASGGGVQIQLSYDQSTNYAHSIRTRHDGSGNTNNAISFYTWTTSDSASDLGTARALDLSSAGAVFNEDSRSVNDFRVESNNNANMIFVDAGYDQVLFGTTTTRANSSGLQKPHIVSGSSVAGQSIDGGATFNTAAYQFSNSLNTTKTIQIYPGSGVYGLLEVHVSGYNSSGSGATHACFHAGGHTGNATLYNIQELYRYNYGNLTTSAATITGGRLQFTVATSGTGTTGLTTFTVKSMDSGAVIPRIVVT